MDTPLQNKESDTLSLYALRVRIRSINNRLFGFFNVFSRKIVRHQRQGNRPGSRDVLPEEIARRVFIALRAGEVVARVFYRIEIFSFACCGKQFRRSPIELIIHFGIIIRP